MDKKRGAKILVIIALLVMVFPAQISAMGNFNPFVETIIKGIEQLLSPPPINIFKAVEKGDVKTVKKIVRCYKTAVFLKNNFGSTPLHEAIKYGHLDIVKYLIEKGANLNAQNAYGDTPFHCVVKTRAFYDVDKEIKLKIIRYLIDKGAKVNIRNLDGHSAVYYAAENRLFEMFKYLLGTKWLPLHYAAESGFFELVKYLVENGAEIGEKNNDGKTALDYAIKDGYLDIVMYLVSKLKGNYTPLGWGIEENNLELVEYMVKNGSDVNELCGLGQTPLQKAVINGSFEIVKILVKNGAEVDSRSIDRNQTPLQFGAFYGHLGIVKFLLEKGATVDAKDDVGATALLLSIRRHNNLDIVKYLVEKGANVNEMPNDGRVAIKRADEWGNFEVVKYLVEKGATLDAAFIEREPLLIKHLIAEIMKDGDLPLHWAIRNEKFELIKYIVEKCPEVDVNKREKDGKIVLHLTAEKGNYDMTKYLVENGAMIGVLANNKLTPCDEANFKLHTKVAEYLELVGNFNKVFVGKIAVEVFVKKYFETQVADINKQNCEMVRGIMHLGSPVLANSLYDRFLKMGLFVLPANWSSGAAWLYLYLFITAKAPKQKFFWYNMVNKAVSEDIFSNASRFNFIFKKNLLACSGMLWENNKLKKFTPKPVSHAIAVKSVPQKFEDMRVLLV